MMNELEVTDMPHESDDLHIWSAQAAQLRRTLLALLMDIRRFRFRVRQKAERI